jgi:hypothetical protein
MRSRLAALSLFVVLPAMNVLAAPAPKKARTPKVYALVDIGKALKSVPPERHREVERECFIAEDGWPWILLRNSQAAKLNVVMAQKDVRAWLNKNLHAEYVGKTDILRIWLADGSPAEQAAIVNAIVRSHFILEIDSRRQLLKDSIVEFQRFLPIAAQCLLGEKAELIALNNAVPADRGEQENLMFQRDRQAREVAAEKKRVAAICAQIEEYEVALRALPRVVKWADEPKPAE